MLGWPQNAYVGQRVVCIDDSLDEWGLENPGKSPVLNHVYTITWVGLCEVNHRDILIDLDDCPSPASADWQRGFNADDFRPVDETRIDVFRNMLHKCNEFV